MSYSDLHTHNCFSFDSTSDPEKAIKSAIDAGLDTVAVTNHCDYDDILDGIYDPVDFEADKNTTLLLKEKYKEKITVIYGIELGQPHLYREKWDELLSVLKPEYVLGSLHNLEKVPDFWFLRFDLMSDNHISHLFDRYLDEMAQLVTVPGITTLSHMNYPIRYIRQSGKNLNLRPFYPKIEAILKEIIARGINLEVNTSGLRQGVGETMPGDEILSLYRECGGTKIAVGSDAHKENDIGANIKEVSDKLRKAGFTVI